MAQVTQSATNRINFAPGSEPTRWSLDLELTENGAYKIHLATAEGLGNKSPVEYSIQAEPDLIPTIELTKPGPELTVAPEVILKLEGEAEDDIGLAKIEQLIKINDQIGTHRTAIRPTTQHQRRHCSGVIFTSKPNPAISFSPSSPPKTSKAAAPNPGPCA